MSAFTLSARRGFGERAPNYKSRGQEFESLRARQLNQHLTSIFRIGAAVQFADRVHTRVHDRRSPMRLAGAPFPAGHPSSASHGPERGPPAAPGCVEINDRYTRSFGGRPARLMWSCRLLGIPVLRKARVVLIAPHPAKRPFCDVRPSHSDPVGLGGIEHNLAKVGVEGSNPFARSNVFNNLATFGVGETDV